MKYIQNTEARVTTLLDLINITSKSLAVVTEGYKLKKKKDYNIIQEIKRKLTELEKSNTEFIEKYESRMEILNGISKTILELQADEFNDNYATMFMLINYNLLDRLEIQKETNSIGIKYSIMEGSMVLGSIEVINDESRTVRVKMSTDAQDFNLEHYYIIYPIITFINTYFNYNLKNVNHTEE